MKVSCDAQSKNSRDRILAAARDLFAERGFHQTAMADLAVRAGVSVGQIYRQFEGKAEIIVAIVHEDSDARFSATSALSERMKSGALPIREAFELLIFDVLAKSSEALWFEIMAEAHRNTIVAERIGTLCDRFRAIMRDFVCAANPQLSDADLDGAQEILMALLFGLGNRSLSRSPLGPEQTARFAAQMVLRALGAA